MTLLAPAYTVRPYADSDERAVVALLERCLAGGPTGHRSGDFYRWKHAANPFGRSLVLVAEAEGRIVGLRTFLRWRFRLAGRVLSAVRAVDTATDPGWRGRGIFSHLTREALDAVRAEGAFVFNTPNGHSLPGYLKLGWRTVGCVPIAVRLVRPVRFALLGRRAIGQRGQPPGPPRACSLPSAAAVLEEEQGIARLLAAAEQDGACLTTDRTPAYLRWRYAQAPGLDYRAVAVHDAAGLAGLAIGRPRRRGPLSEFTLSEVLVRGGCVAVARRLLSAVTRTGCDHVAAHLAPGSVVARAGRREGYLTGPRLGMTLVAHPGGAPAAVDLLRLGAWRLSLGDLEVF